MKTIELNEQQIDFLKGLINYGIFENDKSSATEKAIANQILPKLEDIEQVDPSQMIEDNLEILEEYFMKNDDRGMMCNKDNIEDEFSSWLEYLDNEEIISIIAKAQIKNEKHI